MRSPRKSRQSAKPLGEFADKSRGVRLQRVMADAGVAARRECEELVLAGAVTVNGKVVDRLPAWVDPAVDKIEVYGRPLRKAEKHIYIMLFKPRGTVCTNSDPEGRPRAIDLVSHPSKPRLYCVGRLDLDSSGLLILTNDGDLSQQLMHPSKSVEKEYLVTSNQAFENAHLDQFLEGVYTPEGKLKAKSIERLSPRRLSMVLDHGAKRQIRVMFDTLGYQVTKLLRVRIGNLWLGDLEPGRWAILNQVEIKMLLGESCPEKPQPGRSEAAKKGGGRRL